MAKHRALIYGLPVPQDWFDALQEFMNGLATPSFNVGLANSTTVQVVAAAGDGVVAIPVGGKWRYNVVTTTAAHPGGGAGSYDVYVVASDNSFAAGGGSGETDNTDYTFGLRIVAGGGAAPTGTYNGKAIALTRKVGAYAYDGAAITGVSQLVGPTPPTTPASGHFIGESITWHGLALPAWASEVWGWTDGSAVSRATYAGLLAAVTSVQTGNKTSGSPVVTGLSSTAGIAVGTPVEGGGVPAGTTVLSIQSASQLTLSQNASSSGSGTVTFFPWGNGDGSTTFNLPDGRGRNWVGLALSGGHADVSGIGATEGLTATFRRPKHRHTNGTALSGTPGLGTLALPNHVHAVNDPGHTHDYLHWNGGNVGGISTLADSNLTDGSDTRTGGIVAHATGITVGNPSSNPPIGGAPSVGSLAVAGLVGVSTNDALDTVPYAVVARPIRLA